MKSKFSLTTPILYLAFNRIDSVKRTFPEIQKAKPKQLFIACDGPRNSEEKIKTDEVRKYLLNNLNWKCEVKTLFRDKNLGCKYAVSSAITWFFENVKQGIILEDDCLPSQSFFRYCQELLEKYEYNQKIMSISGNNQLNYFPIKESYLFSKYFFCWGWATWRRAWEKIDIDMKIYHKNSEIKINKMFPGFIERYLLRKRLNDSLKGKINSWAFSFLFTQINNEGLCIVPKNNLIRNIGLSRFSTHTKENPWDKKFLDHPANEVTFPLIHPNKLYSNSLFDKMRLRQDMRRVFLKKISSLF